MKGYILVDIPVDDPIEIDEYGMRASLHISPDIPSKHKELYFDIEYAEIKPMPERKPTDFMNYWFNQGWNALHKKIFGEDD